MGKRKYKPMIFQTSKKLKSMRLKLNKKSNYTGNKHFKDTANAIGRILKQRGS